MKPQSSDHGSRKIGVVVAHGVGETEAGQCISTFAKTLACVGVNTSDEARVIYLPDNDPFDGPTAPAEASAAGADAADANAARDRAASSTFPVHTRRATLGTGEELVMSEFFWSDLTRLKPGVLNAMFGLFRVIFEAHHIVYAMLGRSKDPVTGALWQVLRALSWALRGPIAGITAALISICAVMLYMSSDTEQSISLWVARQGWERWSNDSAGLMLLVIHLGLLLAASLLMLNRRRVTDGTWRDTTAWIALVAIIIIATQAAGQFLTIAELLHYAESSLGGSMKLVYGCTLDACQRSTYINTIYGVFKLAWIVWGMLACVGAAIYVILTVRRLLRPKREESGSVSLAPASAATGVVILQFMLWSALVIPAAMPILNRATLLELLSKKGVWEQLDPVLQRRYAMIELGWVERLTGSYAITLAGVLATLLTVLIVVGLRKAIAWSFRSGLERAEALMPRLLFSGWVIAILFAFAAIQMSYVAGSDFAFLSPGGQIADTPLSAPADNVFQTAVWPKIKVLVGVVALFSVLLIGSGFANGVHIARDLIDYQFRVHASDASPSDTPTGLLDLRNVGRRLLQLDKHRKRRRHMLLRLSDVVDHLLQENQLDQVILVAHSQGTVIVFDYLDKASLRSLRPSILTFGSPLAHLYGHYYPEYADLANKLSQYQNVIDRWFNLYRIDDYVGRRIDAPDDFIVNCPIEPGGHTNYWPETLVAQALIALATGKRRPPWLDDGQEKPAAAATVPTGDVAA
jgi:hypothetical protein